MRRFIGTILCVCLAVVSLSLVSCGNRNRKETSAHNIVHDMGAGWNLGNSLDCIDGNQGMDNSFYETVWGNPLTTKEMIQAVKEAGFGAVRVPVTYYNHIDENHTIDQQWLQRVKEIVDYVIDQGMYCIINIHHDTGNNAWISADSSRMEEMKNNISTIWKQIAVYFKDYDEHLLFEGYNEILDEKNQWTGAGSDAYAAANELNQQFVDTVRNTDGNNKERFLIVNTYAAGVTEEIVSGFSLPKDSTENHLIAEVHYYSQTETEFDTAVDVITRYFQNKKIPAIIGEFGVKSSTDDGAEQQREDYISYIVAECRKLGIGYFWWDDGKTSESGDPVDTYALLNRNTCEWYFPDLVKCLTEK